MNILRNKEKKILNLRRLKNVLNVKLQELFIALRQRKRDFSQDSVKMHNMGRKKTAGSRMGAAVFCFDEVGFPADAGRPLFLLAGLHIY